MTKARARESTCTCTPRPPSPRVAPAAPTTHTPSAAPPSGCTLAAQPALGPGPPSQRPSRSQLSLLPSSPSPLPLPFTPPRRPNLGPTPLQEPAKAETVGGMERGTAGPSHLIPTAPAPPHPTRALHVPLSTLLNPIRTASTSTLSGAGQGREGLRSCAHGQGLTPTTTLKWPCPRPLIYPETLHQPQPFKLLSTPRRSPRKRRRRRRWSA